ncbi:hypothetical protein Pint_21732 [Pistacia integerrima]|uniref:Uncharacterized protein n=1 Tax=Pistacia integerrima TaxID=434235 RepID=A0ACC0X8W5_9ROSI|nr:hypothetical protein Pint_21732 [Pistacia integerrima]
MMLRKVSDVFGIQPRPFDPETYVEEQDENMDVAADPKKHFIYQRMLFVGGKSRIKMAQPLESNARFIRWSDGSFQLQIGDEAFDVTKQDIQNEESPLFVRHDEQVISLCFFIN